MRYYTNKGLIVHQHFGGGVEHVEQTDAAGVVQVDELVRRHPRAVEAQWQEFMAEHVGQLEPVALDARPLVRWRQQHHGGDDEREHEHDDQQGDEDAPPVALVGGARHQLLCTRVRRKGKRANNRQSRLALAHTLHLNFKSHLFLIGHLCVRVCVYVKIEIVY